MSKPAYVRLVEQIPAIRKMQYTDSTGKARHIGETGAWLLVYLCSELNKDGTFFMTAESMRELTGTSTVAEIRRLLAGFEQLGLITRTGEEISYLGRGRPTPVYAMTFVPGLWKPEVISSPISSPVSSPGATRTKHENPYGEKETSLILEIEPEPEPQTEPQPQPKAHNRKQAGTGGGGGELSKEGTELLAKVVATEDLSRAENPIGLRKYLEGQYLPIVQAWEKEQPSADPVTWCREQRGYVSNPVNKNQRATYLPDVPQGSQGCPHGCEGQGFHQFYDSEVMHQVTRKCVCAGGTYSLIDTREATTERVSADKASNTYVPDPGAPADPQSDPVEELTRRLRAV